MANITTRRIKGAALTFDEVDNNFTGLASDTATLLGRVYTPIANVTGIPVSPASGDRIEISNSTGIRGLSNVQGIPASFPSTGDVSDLQVRLQYSASLSAWQWISYEARTPDARYLTSPAFTGAPTAPTATAGTSTTQLATTEFATIADRAISNSTGRNKLINGGFLVAQLEGTASAVTSLQSSGFYQYLIVDRWFAYVNASANGSLVRSKAANGSYRVLLTAPASNTAAGLAQRIEAINTLSLFGNTCTLSATISSATNTSVTWSVYYPTTAENTFGTAASPTKTLIASGTWTVNATGTRYSAQVNVPAAGARGLEVHLSLGAGAVSTYFSEVQFEPGAVMTSFDQRSYGHELFLCQRYLELCPASVFGSHWVAGGGVGTHYRYSALKYKVGGNGSIINDPDYGTSVLSNASAVPSILWQTRKGYLAYTNATGPGDVAAAGYQFYNVAEI
jgi:hypothetical protein